MESEGWVREGLDVGDDFDRVALGVLTAIFRDTNMGESYDKLRQITGKDEEADNALLQQASLLMEPYHNWTTQFESKHTGMTEDALRIKPGASTGLAVRSGTYERLGTPAMQEEVDYSAYVATVKGELGMVINPCSFGGFHKWGYANGWMVYFMENPIKKNDLGVPPIYGNPPYVFFHGMDDPKPFIGSLNSTYHRWHPGHLTAWQRQCPNTQGLGKSWHKWMCLRMGIYPN